MCKSKCSFELKQFVKHTAECNAHRTLSAPHTVSTASGPGSASASLLLFQTSGDWLISQCLVLGSRETSPSIPLFGAVL